MAIGADRDRTGNLRVANAALSQLSYGPGNSPTSTRLVAFPGASAPASAAEPPDEKRKDSRQGQILQQRRVHFFFLPSARCCAAEWARQDSNL